MQIREEHLKQLEIELPDHPHTTEDLSLNEWKAQERPYCWADTISDGSTFAYFDSGYGLIALFEQDEPVKVGSHGTVYGRQYIATFHGGLRLFQEVAKGEHCGEQIE